MNSPKSTTALLFVWGAAFTALGVLVDTFQPVPVPPRALEAPAPPSARPTDVAPRFIELDPVLIIGRRPSPATARAAPPAEEPHESACGAWRELVQGDIEQRVRACE